MVSGMELVAQAMGRGELGGPEGVEGVDSSAHHNSTALMALTTTHITTLLFLQRYSIGAHNEVMRVGTQRGYSSCACACSGIGCSLI